MLYAKHILEPLELKVEFPILLEIDNNGSVDLANNWIVEGRTRYGETRNFLKRA